MPGWGTCSEIMTERVFHNKPGEPWSLKDVVTTGGVEASAYVAAPMHAGSGFIGQVYCRNLGADPVNRPYSNVAIELGGPLASNQVMVHYSLGIGKFAGASYKLDCAGNANVGGFLVLPNLGNYISDTDAKVAGVPLYGLYSNNGGVQVRLLP